VLIYPLSKNTHEFSIKCLAWKPPPPSLNDDGDVIHAFYGMIDTSSFVNVAEKTLLFETEKMLNPPKKLCRDCNKNPPHTWRRICMTCIQRIAKEKAKIALEKKKEKAKTKKQLAKKKKAFSESKLTDIADKLFSLYIRRRDKDLPCCTCWQFKEDMQCGHFVTRGEYSVRWDEKNADKQCWLCNSKFWGNGEVWKHGKYIDKKWGEWTADYLEWQRGVCKVFDYQKLEIIRKYYYKLLDLGTDSLDIYDYFQKAYNSKSFDITNYL